MSRPKGPRHLSPEDEALWAQITARTRPLERPVPTLPNVLRTPKTKPVPTAVPAPLPAFRIGERSAGPKHGDDLARPIAQALGEAPVAMDRKAHRRMTKGKLTPEARIDLHGLTLADAEPRLNRFILDAQARGLRLVLVITGKGRVRDDDGPIPTRPGALRHHVPRWLHGAVLRSAVLQVTPAHRRHGGEGAYYVYLRRSR